MDKVESARVWQSPQVICSDSHHYSQNLPHRSGYGPSHTSGGRPRLRACFLVFLALMLFCDEALGKATVIPLWKAKAKQRSGRAVNEAVQESRDVSGVKHTSSAGLRSQEDNLGGQPGEGYYVQMAVGTPPQKFNILVDTGSSNFALAATPQPDITTYFNIANSSTYEDSGRAVTVPYTQGNWAGTLGVDYVTLTSMENSTILADVAFITSSEDFFINGSDWQGILGLAYPGIARPDESVEPYFDSMVRELGLEDVFSIQLCGTKDDVSSGEASMAGSLVLGGMDSSLYKGEMYYTPLYKEWYYEVVLTDISVNGQSVGMDCKEYNFDKTIVDSGTTNLRLPNKVFNEVLSLIQQNTHTADQEIPYKFWSGEDLLCWSRGSTPWYSFPSIGVSLAVSANDSVTLTMSPQQYMRRVSADSEEGTTFSILTGEANCYKFAISPSDTGAVLGAVVMEGFYVVFDRKNRRIGFAVNTCDNRDPDALEPSISTPKHYGDTMDCAYIKAENNQSVLLIVAYVMAGICAVCLLPLLYLLVHWQINRCRQPPHDDTTGAPSDGHGLLNDDNNPS